MAEVVGLVVGVVSLGVQLAESTRKVRRFYNAVKDAPERLADTIDEIESLSEILTEMEGDRNSCNTVTGPKMQRCVATCREAVDRFSVYADHLERRMKRHRLRGSAKFALKSESIEGVVSRLESSKSNLVLAYMLYRETMSDARESHMQMQVAKMQTQLQTLLDSNALLVQHVSSPSSRCVLLTETPEVSRQKPNGRSTTFRLRTPSWLSLTIWEIHLKRATAGWTISFRTYNTVPHDAAIFKACEHGDIKRMRELFDSGFASPFDENEFGKGIFEVSTNSINANT